MNRRTRKTHVSSLFEGVEPWNQWRRSKAAAIPHLGGAILRKMDLRGIDLNRAQLQNADLSGADLSYSVLSHADLTNASLVRANLTGAMLACANFTNVRMGGTLLCDLDMRSVAGLDHVIHCAPSALSIDSLHRSGEHVSPVFLRQCGVSADLLPLLFPMSASPAYLLLPQCVISYCDEDFTFAKHLATFLMERGVRCYLRAPEDLHWSECGETPPIHMGSVAILLCCSRASLTNAAWRKSDLAPFLEKRNGRNSWSTDFMRVLKLDDCLTKTGIPYAARHKLSMKIVASFDLFDWKTDTCNFEKQVSLVTEFLQTCSTQLEA